MKSIDMRFEENTLKKWIGKSFVKYKCDPFAYTNSVTAIVGIFIDNEIYKLTNIQTTVDYFGINDDCGVFTLEQTESSNIKSLFDNVKQIETPISETIQKITVINENQRIYQNGEQTYNVWLTRGIIFHFLDREISFEKDNIPFSEEIIIRRGYQLEKQLSDKKDFLEGWDDGITPQCSREYMVIE